MILRMLPMAFFVLSLALFGAAGFAYFLLEDSPGAIVNEPNPVFPDLRVGANEVHFRLENPTRHKIRVVGFSFC